MKLNTPDIKKFLNDAGKQVDEMALLQPWEDPKLRDDVMKTMVVRIPEKQKAKLDYLVSNMPESTNKLINNLIDSFINKELA